jgi:enoyl-CoA hydratase/carnithine racemase
VNSSDGRPAEDILQVRREGPIAVMTMNQPQRRNAFNLAMRTAMYACMLELAQDETCRAIVLTGAGGHFCAGGDISEMKHRSVLEARVRMDLPTRIFKLLVNGPKPFLTAVEGSAAGCGVSFVAASDYAVAASDARFSCAFVNVGLIPDVGGIWSLPRKVGHRKALEMCAFAEPIDATEALRCQLINRISEPGKALEEALKVAERFCRNPPMANALLKAALNTGNDSLDAAIQTELTFQSILMNTEDYAEAAKAFLEKRKPVFLGK